MNVFQGDLKLNRWIRYLELSVKQTETLSDQSLKAFPAVIKCKQRLGSIFPCLSMLWALYLPADIQLFGEDYSGIGNETDSKYI